jgi:GTP-binding protein
MESSERHNTLVHFRFNPEYKAQRGRHGEGSNRTGREGIDIILKVPVGTILYDAETGEKIHDFSRPDERIVVAQGGRGGRGNARFATSTHQAPREHEDGRPGEDRVFRLELKLLADVGLVGFPNVGKSTLISRISAARPKIADYPFTTLQPNLGVVAVGQPPEERSFVVADIPGLIEGAHSGAGLGIQFLRHIERTRLLVHLVDVSDANGRPDPVKDVEVINKELESFGAGLEGKPMIMAASKIDVANKDKLAKLKRYCKKQGLELFPISAVTGKGIDELKYAIAEKLDEVKANLQSDEASQKDSTAVLETELPQRSRKTS